MPGCVRIAAHRDANRLTLCVSDDGVGLGTRSSDSLGIGLKNVRARLDQLHGSDAVLTLENAAPHGTVATIRIPYRACTSYSNAAELLK
jgi:LytS/YehU family sensor histidine kinase